MCVCLYVLYNSIEIWDLLKNSKKIKIIQCVDQNHPVSLLDIELDAQVVFDAIACIAMSKEDNTRSRAP